MMKSELYIDVRYYETDQMGIVHHSNYIRYFECGRSDFMVKAGLPVPVIEQAGVTLPVVKVESRYKFPAKMGDRLRIVSMVTKPPMAKLEIESKIYNQDNILLCEGTVVIGFLDAKKGMPIRCPEKLREILLKGISENLSV